MKTNKDNNTSPQTTADICLIEAAHIYAYKDWREDSLCGIAYYAFKAGAEWAQKEFVKSLWHKASEVPEKCKPCLVYGVFTYEDKEPIADYFTTTYTSYGWAEDYFPRDYDGVIERWCYIDDILPKKGGEG